MSDIKTLAQRLRKSLLNKGAARRLHGRFDPDSDHDLHDIAGEWVEHGDPENREMLAERQPDKGETLRVGNKLAQHTKSRRNPLTGEREFLLHRGVHDQELADAHESGAGYSGASSWTPHFSTALKFSRDYNRDSWPIYESELPDESGRFKAKPHPEIIKRVKSAWIPESKIALVPNQFALGVAHSDEHEVIVKPFRPQHASLDEIKHLVDSASYQKPDDGARHDLKQHLRAKFGLGKSIAAAIESLQKAVPQKKEMAEFFHDLGAHRRFETADDAVDWVREHIRRENGIRERAGAPQIDVDKDVLPYLAQVKVGKDYRIIAPHKGATNATVNVPYNPKIGEEWHRKAMNYRFNSKADAEDWLEREAMSPGLGRRPLDVFPHVKIIQDKADNWRIVRGDYPGSRASELPETENSKPQTDGDSDFDASDNWVRDPDLVLSKDHIPDLWKDHHSDLIDGLAPDTSERDVERGVTPNIRVAEHSRHPISALIKQPLSESQYKEVEPDLGSHGHFLDEDFTSSHREAVYHRLADKFFGMGDFVPRTTVFKHPKTGTIHSAQEFLPDTKSYYAEVAAQPNAERKEFLAQTNGTENIQKLAIMNAILGNNDRHAGNVLLDKNNKIKLIDHGLTMDYGYDPSRRWLGNSPVDTKGPHYAQPFLNDGVHPQTHQWLDSLEPKSMAEHMAASGVPPKLAAVAVNRLAEVKKWSKHERSRHRDGKQEHQGRLQTALSVSTAHRLNEHGVLRPSEEVDTDRKQFYAATDKLGGGR